MLRQQRVLGPALWLIAATLMPSGEAFSQSGSPNGLDVRPFTIHVDDATLADLRERLARTRFPDELPGVGWELGVPTSYLRELIEYWRTGYDWRTWEKRLNSFPNFKTRIDGLDIHFVHVRSRHESATPLVLTHGWPGSFVEFYKVIGPLTDPEAHGGKAEDAFHVVVPSLPGFGFSEAPKERGWSVNRMAAVIAELMSRLGYQRYGAQGGDWGAGVSRWLGNYDSEHVIGVHLNFVGGNQPASDPWEGVTPAERERFERRGQELANQRAYSAIQGTRPQTLGQSLNDSSAGLAAWIIDKFWAWSDHRGNLENSFSKDELLTNVMIYWVTQTAASSARIYFERDSYNGGRKSGRAPIGVALFPKEINVPPRKWVEAQYGAALVHWTDMPRGGHFAALEQPELLVEDIRAFFRKVESR
jgi:pimeloyl-ACP methyl ester carboxylesterase